MYDQPVLDVVIKKQTTIYNMVAKNKYQSKRGCNK